MKFFRRTLLILVGAAVAAGTFYAFMPRPLVVDVVAVGRGPLEVSVNEEGKTRIRERYVVSTPLAGQLRRIELDPGDPVAAGETVIASIVPDAPKLLDPRQRAEADARLSGAKSSVQRAEANLEAARVARDMAESQQGRLQRLRNEQSTSEKALEDATLSMRARQEEFRAAQFSIDIAQFEEAQAAAALARFDVDGESAPDANSQFDIRSPISGKVLRLLQQSAAVVLPGTQLMELGDPSNLELEIDVLSTDAVKISPGDEIRLEHWGGDEPLTGTVRIVEPAAFTKISALGVEEQRVYVIGDLGASDSQRSRLGDGFRFEGRVIIWREDNVLQAPMSALFRRDDGWAAFVVTGETLELRPVVLGHRNADAAEILDGLAEGDRVVIYPGDEVLPGIKIVARPAK